jgi:hypothetical protein
MAVFATSAYLWLIPGGQGWFWLSPIAGIEFGVFALVLYRDFHVLPHKN